MSKIYQYIWISEGTGDVHIPPSIFCLLFQKTEHDLYLNQILNLLIKKFFPIMNNKFFTKSESQARISLWSEYSSSNWFHSNTPGIFLIQIVNTNNTNVYLINFHSKNNIKMRFLKSWVLKFQTNLNHSLFIATRLNKLRRYQQRLPNNVSLLDFQKSNLINNYFIYS